MYINNLGHMTKMAAMPIYGKNPSKIIFSETNRLISRKLGVRHRWLKYSNVYINHDPVMTLTKFMARSTWVACASELGKLLKCHLKEKANRKLANGQNIEDSEKRKWPKGLSAPALELNTIIFKHVYWYMQLISGERLQDHWSSGSLNVILCFPQILDLQEPNMRVVLERFQNDLKLLQVPNKTLKSEGFFKTNKVYIETRGSAEDEKVPFQLSKFYHLLDRHQNTIRIHVNLPLLGKFIHEMSRRMGKPTICIDENKGADQLCSNCEADLRLYFR